MSKWFAEALAIVLSLSTLTPLEGAESRLPSHGKETVQEVEAAYREGAYDTFLSELTKQYERAGAAGALRGVFESAKSALMQRDAFAALPKADAQTEALAEVRNLKLLEAIAVNPDLSISQKVETVVSFSLPSAYSAVLAELRSLQLDIPEAGTSTTAQAKISALETEYYIKSLLIDIAQTRSGSSDEEINKKKIALSLEKLERMEEAADEYGDDAWAMKVDMAKKAYRLDRAYRLDLAVLKGLAEGRIAAQNAVEEKVKGVMMDYLTQAKEVLDQNLNSEVAQK